MVSFEHKEKANTTGRGGAFLRIIPYRKKPDEERSLTMKNFQNLLYFVAMLAMLVVYVFVVSRQGLPQCSVSHCGRPWRDCSGTDRLRLAGEPQDRNLIFHPFIDFPYETGKTPARSAGVFSVPFLYTSIRNADGENRDSSFYKWEEICYSTIRN